MTSRMQSPHTTCPGCQEEVFLDELVGGKCPLCGCSLEEFDESFGEYEGILDRSDLSWLIFNYFVFKKFVDLGVPPHQIMEFVAAYEAERREAARGMDEDLVHPRDPDAVARQNPAQALCEVREMVPYRRQQADHR